MRYIRPRRGAALLGLWAMQSALPLGLLVMAATPLWAPRAVKAALPLCLSVV